MAGKAQAVVLGNPSIQFFGERPYVPGRLTRVLPLDTSQLASQGLLYSFVCCFLSSALSFTIL